MQQSPDEEDILDLAGQVRQPTIDGLPGGYRYGVTRYADVILQEAFRDRFDDLQTALEEFQPTLDELRAGGGGRTVFVRRFDESLGNMVEAIEEDLPDDAQANRTIWGKQNITIEKSVGFDGQTEPVSKVRGHEIDMFGKGSLAQPFPGVAVEMEWNNKDPFFDRDLINFQALHHEGAIAVGVIVTRGPELQSLVSGVIRSKDGGFKYGSSTTHWNKLIPRVNLGGGGECPLLLIGIEPDRIHGARLAYRVRAKLDEADALRASWRETYDRWSDAKRAVEAMRAEAFDLLPPLAEN
ncbi:MAG: BglII/BstYI family type II restriction endonuclease [Acidimicrobiaceae bacterium]|nr:BglII/BstYI family type II restriction endonuclease [Acidimicrobiaceae bacterium]